MRGQGSTAFVTLTSLCSRWFDSASGVPERPDFWTIRESPSSVSSQSDVNDECSSSVTEGVRHRLR
jgi:hypothetical protein